jgi:hypothetical protein
VVEPGDGPGVTSTTITAGVTYDPNSAAEDSALGAAGANPGDEKAETDAVVNYVNAHGGIAHRKLVINYYLGNTEVDTASQIYQAACNAWTQDTKTFIIPTGTPILDQCVANEHALGVNAQFVAETSPILQQFPSDVNINGFTIDRGMRVTVEGLADQHYFTGKLGIVTWDENDYHYGITSGALPALAALGIHNPPVEYVTVPQTYGDLGSTSSSVASAVLQFKTQGIDHVILFDGPAGINSSGVLVLEFLQQANSQQYYPRYGLNSTSGFDGLASDYPPAEMANSIGVGWFPSLDLDSADYKALPQTPLQKLCLKIEAAAGQAATSTTETGLQLTICDDIFFLQYALGKVTGPLNQQNALAAIDSVGSSWQSLSTFGVYFSATQHDAAEQVRNVTFVPSCTCYRYDSGSYTPS